MKFLFSSATKLYEDDAESQFQGGLKKTLRFHKNLFFGNLSPSGAPCAVADPFDEDEDRWSDGYATEEEDYSDGALNQRIRKTSKVYRLNNLSLPLSDTFGEYVQELSEDRFFLDDLSFIFEMSRNQSVSPYAIIVAMLYLKRLKYKSFDKASKELNISNMELCLISILLASKYLTDEGEPEEIYNDDWARATDLSVADINRLEKRFLNLIDWNLYISNDEFVHFSKDLAKKITFKKIKLQHDMCTYSDLDCLLSLSSELSVERIRAQLALLSKVFFVCSSTLVYLLFSSLLVTSCLIYLRSHIIYQYQLSLLKHASLFVSQSSTASMPASELNSFNRTRTSHDQNDEIASLCVLNMRGATMNDYDSIEGLLLNVEAKKSIEENSTTTASMGEPSRTRMDMSTLNRMNGIGNKPGRHVCASSSRVKSMGTSTTYNLHKPKTLGKEDMLKNLFSSILVK